MSAAQPHKVVSLAEFKAACQSCSLFQLCLPMGIADNELALLDKIIRRRRPLKRGEHLYQQGHSFQSLYAVRSGSIKTYATTEDGREQVTGFHLPGELLGLDAICTERHGCAAVALETCTVCELPYDQVDRLNEFLPGLQQQLVRMMSREILGGQALLALLGKRSAEERLAAYLLNLSGRFQRRGLSGTEFIMSMSRTDIGNYMGLAVETVSRMFTRFQEMGILSVRRKHVVVHQPERLRAIACQSGGCTVLGRAGAALPQTETKNG